MSAVLLNALAPIFVGMALGYLAGWSGMIGIPGVAGLNALVMNFALPAAAFLPTALTPWPTLVAQSGLLLVLAVAMLGIYGLVYVGQRRLFTLSSSAASIEALTVSLPNYGAAGLPLMASVFGPASTVYVALALAWSSILLSPLTLVVLEANASRGTHGGVGVVPRAIGRSLLKPIVLGPLVAVIFARFAIPVPEFLSNSLSLFGEVAAGGALFVTGLVLAGQRPLLTRNVMAGVLIKNALQPAITLGCVLLLPISRDAARTAIVLSALPCGFFGVLFGVRYEVRSREAGSTLLVSTALSAVTLAVTLILIRES